MIECQYTLFNIASHIPWGTFNNLNIKHRFFFKKKHNLIYILFHILSRKKIKTKNLFWNFILWQCLMLIGILQWLYTRRTESAFQLVLKRGVRKGTILALSCQLSRTPSSQNFKSVIKRTRVYTNVNQWHYPKFDLT